MHRFQNYYGEDYARLCRDQRCLEASSIQPTFLMRACFIGLFNMPNSFKADLDGLFIDNLLHIIHWRTFSNMLRTSWKTSCIEVSDTNYSMLHFINLLYLKSVSELNHVSSSWYADSVWLFANFLAASMEFCLVLAEHISQATPAWHLWCFQLEVSTQASIYWNSIQVQRHTLPLLWYVLSQHKSCSSK